MAVLLTGFEPFGGAEENPSWEAVARVADVVAGHEVHRLRLPTVYGEAAELLCREIERVRPEVVICCGVASGRKGVAPELVAINYRMAGIADNAGQKYEGVPINLADDAAYMTALPVHAMIAAMRAAEIPAYLSLSAGAYVCNDVYYALLRGQRAGGYRGLFVHVPDADVVDAAQGAKALTICLETALA